MLTFFNMPGRNLLCQMPGFDRFQALPLFNNLQHPPASEVPSQTLTFPNIWRLGMASWIPTFTNNFGLLDVNFC